VPVRDLYVSILTTVLAADELVTEIRVPMPRPPSGGAYEKLERKVGDYAVIGVGAQVALAEDGSIRDAGIGLCNAGSTSIKASAAEAFLRGKPPAPDNINQAAELAEQAADPVEDDRGPVDYKRAMVRELTRRALRRALERARGGIV
jgi:carbon-monoxide dehydrogenase medium subunit